MTKRIFKSILTVAAAILVACFIIILGMLYDYFTGLSETEMKTQTAFVAHALENEGESYFDGLDSGAYRITWIASDGTVIYDSRTDASVMENHADREEFIEALQSGSGDSRRYSATLTQRMLYYARRLSDGSVVRVSSTQNSIVTLVMGMLQPVLVVLLLAIVFSAVLASRLSKRIVKPLNELDLEAPLENKAYEELSPLLGRIAHQQREISAQLERLKRTQTEWNAIADSMNEGIVLLGVKNNILSINKSAMRLLDTDRDCIGNDFLTVCRRLDIQALLEKAAAGEKAELSLELGGRDYQVDASSIPSDSGTKGTELLFFDVTEKARGEQMRREFTANVSHELKTPLHTISGTAEIMKDGLVEQEDIPRFSEHIYNESQRMITLVDDIIRLSKLDEGAGDMPRDALSLRDYARDALSRLKPQADAKQVTMELSGDEGKLFGVGPLIMELVYNLCDNAVKYNRTGGSVKVGIEDSQGEVKLTVADTGIGIPEEYQDRIFERFYRVDKSHSKEIGGTGLGLSIVKHVAKIHNAHIELSSKPDKGTTISGRFPQKDPAMA